MLVAGASLVAAPSRLALPRYAASLSVALAAAAAWFVIQSGASHPSVWVGWSLFEVGVRVDPISLTLLALVSFVGALVLRYSERYLEGDARHASFISRTGLTLAAVQMFALSPSLFQLAAGAVLVSVGLHTLLLHFPERAGARQAAWTKFIVSRTGDLCIAGGVVWTYLAVGTTELTQVFAAVSGPGAPWGLIALLFAVGALCKSAQLPFHTWLPETLETPTPVSAFMHAGVVNAGGFLVIRLHPLFENAIAASSLLAVVGALTAAYGALVMLAQTTIKRALAYSTIAQMGFMILQCGVGAYSLALLHIVAHAIYKSNAFLRSGSTVYAPPRTAVVLPLGSLAVGLLVAIGLGATLPWTFPEVRANPATAVFAVSLLGACAYSIARFHAASGFSSTAVRGFGLALGAFGLAVVLHAAVMPLVPASPQPLPVAVVAFVALLFVSLLVFQFCLARIHMNPGMRHLYVHASHGFYLGPWVNRQLRRLIPIPAAP
jgi:NAD(P)H-quinone oxidoreductase subunit 5